MKHILTFFDRLKLPRRLMVTTLTRSRRRGEHPRPTGTSRSRTVRKRRRRRRESQRHEAIESVVRGRGGVREFFLILFILSAIHMYTSIRITGTVRRSCGMRC